MEQENRDGIFVEVGGTTQVIDPWRLTIIPPTVPVSEWHDVPGEERTLTGGLTAIDFQAATTAGVTFSSAAGT